MAEAFHRRKHPLWISWRMDGPLSQSKGTGALSRAVEQHGHTMNFLFSATGPLTARTSPAATWMRQNLFQICCPRRSVDPSHDTRVKAVFQGKRVAADLDVSRPTVAPEGHLPVLSGDSSV